MPKKRGIGDGLLHGNCDCELFKISKPEQQIKVVCNINKFNGYIFSVKYIKNGKKALFESLGFSIEDSQNLKDEYENQAKEKYLNGDYIIRGLDTEYGQDINIVIAIIPKRGKKVNLISGWKVHPLGLITCNTTLLADNLKEINSMKIWDNILLTSEIDNLSKNGIHKGIDGTIVSINGEFCTVWFSNPKNYGEYAFAKINVKFLQLGEPIPYTEKMLAEMESIYCL